MVSAFQEQELDKYFLHFERVAKYCNWPKDSWTMLLQSVLLGKAREIFSQLSIEDSSKYDTVKQLMLKGYELVPKAYRQKFRTLSKSSTKTFIEFAQEKARLFDCWCTSENVENNHNHLRELIFIEEFKNCPRHSKFGRKFLPDTNFRPLQVTNQICPFLYVATILVHSTINIYHLLDIYREDIQGNDFSPFNNKPCDETSESYRRQPPFKPIVCDYCKRRGHTKSECSSFKLNKPPPKPTGFISASKNIPKFHCPDERQQPWIPDFDNKPYIHNTENKLEVKRSTDPTMDT